jgi:hypothetical protein
VTTDMLTGPAPTIPRDPWGRPLLPPPNPPGAKPVPYTRATTMAGALDDQFGLTLWKQRTVALGLAARHDLLAAVASTSPGDKERLNELVEAAMDAGGGTVAATVGTALHAFTERIDRGLDVGHVPAQYEADVAAYQELAAKIGWQVDAVEQFTVLDPFRIAGTADRILTIDGRTYIADIKTGSDVSYHHGWAVQFAIYAHGLPYDVEARKRVPWPNQPDQDRAVVVHLPAGQGTARAYWIDIAAGWEALALALKVRGWRGRRDLLSAYTPRAEEPDPDPIMVAIAAAVDVPHLNQVWARHQNEWTRDHTAAAVARKAALLEGTAP